MILMPSIIFFSGEFCPPLQPISKQILENHRKELSNRQVLEKVCCALQPQYRNLGALVFEKN